MDVVTLGVLEKKARSNAVAKDNSLRKIHTKILNAFGPFARVWRDIDNSTSGDMSRPVTMNLLEMKKQCEHYTMKKRNDKEINKQIIDSSASIKEPR